MIEFHLGTLESSLLAAGFCAWMAMKAIDVYFSLKIKRLEKMIELERAKEAHPHD